MGQPQELAKTYDPKKVEEKWYAYWEKRGYFEAKGDEDKQPYAIVIPPPNVTGSLHMGHALNNTLQDVLVRWKRMQGYDVLWLPGTDHAGIATQIKVEEVLRETEGKSRHDLGREAFLERVWQWKEHYRDRIVGQLKKLGVSCDWSRERFTMDSRCSRAVREVFVHLYNKGLIYRGRYIINWCPYCQTTLSDLEVEHEEVQGKIWHLRYPYRDREGYIVVATTRPETMLGDTAVAVHPDDPRYKELIGEKVILPLMDREIPIVADSFVDPEFGTGMVKVTPAHDPNDFEIGLRHNLEQIQVIGDDGRMTEAAGRYAGLDRYEARQRVVEDLEQLGLLEKVEEHVHAVGHCYRCGNVVEPLVSDQWFVKMKPLAEPAIRAVKEGDIRFVPERFSKNYLHWMENIRDWCISRQLWWGHRIPVWTCVNGHEFAAVEDPSACPTCGSSELTQDPDVLDTWFSSALWPFSTMGWPERTPDLERYYPTDVLVTGFDIIYFWVARMIFMGLEFMKEKPFSDVLIHGLVRDHLGRKMSKSLGNGVDPLEVIEEYGADALRMTLVTGVAPGNDMRYQPEKVEASRNFANKIWNATRFALMHLADFAPADGKSPKDPSLGLELALADRWILSRYDRAVREVTRHLNRYDLGEGARTLYDFTWSELCDWYIEVIKPRLYGREGEASKASAQYVLWYVLKGTLELLHPYMPFVTEELWSHLPGTGESIMIAPWPAPNDELQDAEAEREMTMLMEVIKAVRNIRAEKAVPPGREVPAVFLADPWAKEVLEANLAYVKTLAKVGEATVAPAGAAKPEKAATAVTPGVEIFLPLAGLVDLDQELARLNKELEQVTAELERARARLANPGFVQKAPAHVVEGARARVRELEATEEKLKARLAELS
ncbi:MAG TPA: valine--tRNA ligase [Limnochordia bacterium]|nr:valine--tRNA ligase [Limnochordia bacterium]